MDPKVGLKRSRKSNRAGESKKRKKTVEVETFEEHDVAVDAKLTKRKKKNEGAADMSGTTEEQVEGAADKLAGAQRANPPDELKTRVGELFKRLKASPPPERRAQVHDSEDKAVTILNKVYELHTKIVDCFQGLTSTVALDRLSNPSVFSKLVVPSLMRSSTGPPPSFTYVGRKKLKELQHILQTVPRMTKLEGYPGRGKSYMIAAMACHLHTYEYELGPVVYIQFSRLVGNFDYLVKALLLAYVRHPDKQLEILARAGSVDDMMEFCEDEEPLVLMDEVNASDTLKEQRQEAMRWMELFRRGVRCGSYSISNERFELRMDEPFDLEEVACWQRSKGLLEEDPEELLHHTGLVPRLLSMYTVHKEAYKDFTRRRLDLYLAGIKTGEDHVRAMQILNGQVKINDLDGDIFYHRPFGEDDTRVSVLPYLQAEMTVRLDMKRKYIASVEGFDAFIEKRSGVRAKLKGDSERGNLPVASQLAESLARECILLCKKCLDWDFKTTIFMYQEKRDAMIDELADQSDKILEAGVCFVPMNCDAQDADLFVVKLRKVQEIKTLEVHAVQITVSGWKARKMRNSHEKWLSKVASTWSRLGCELVYDFTYVLPNSLEQDVKEKVTRVKFSDVHKWLGFIDNLHAPELKLRK